MFHINDNTAGAQRMSIDNSYHTEIGGATPSAPLTVNGSVIIDSSSGVAQNSIAPPAMPRILGSFNLTGEVNVSVPSTTSAIGSISGNGQIVGYSSDHTQITIAPGFQSEGSLNITYGVF